MWTPVTPFSSVAGSYHLGGGGAGDGGARTCTGCEAGFPLCCMAVTTQSQQVLIPSCWSRSPEGWVGLILALFLIVFPSPCTRTFAPKEGLCAYRSPVLCLCSSHFFPGRGCSRYRPVVWHGVSHTQLGLEYTAWWSRGNPVAVLLSEVWAASGALLE